VRRRRHDDAPGRRPLAEDEGNQIHLMSPTDPDSINVQMQRELRARCSAR
jgi:hypothetical protein